MIIFELYLNPKSSKGYFQDTRSDTFWIRNLDYPHVFCLFANKLHIYMPCNITTQYVQFDTIPVFTLKIKLTSEDKNVLEDKALI